MKFSPNKTGSKKKPAALGWTQTLAAANNTSGDRAAPLIDIKTLMYGIKVDQKDFAKCSATTIATPPKYDQACNQKALVAQGPVNAKLGDSTLQGPGAPCNPWLTVWNEGKGKLAFFFKTFGQYQCAGLATGATAPYEGTLSKQGKFAVLDVPLPPPVSTNVARVGLYGSLIHEQLKYSKLTKKVKGKKVSFWSSVGCKNGNRPWEVFYTAQTSPGPPAKTETQEVTGSAKCTK